MNYDNIILELADKIGKLTAENAVLLERIRQEIKNKENVEEKYLEAISELSFLKNNCKCNKGE